MSKGKCEFCGETFTGRGLSRHLGACAARKVALLEERWLKSRPQPIYHVVVQDAWSNDFWLHLAVSAKATLADLDHYLRTIWLECCGHLSHFQPGWST
jgi:hypothetical protein